MPTYPEPSNITGFQGLFDYADSVSKGSFYWMIPVTLWIVIFLYFKGKNYYTGDSATAASFSTLMVSVFLWLMGGLSNLEMFLLTSLLVISVVIAVWVGNE